MNIYKMHLAATFAYAFHSVANTWKSDVFLKKSVGAEFNQAGYTAISRVQLGRGSNAKKSTKTLFLRKRDQRTNGPTDGLTDGPTDGRKRAITKDPLG